MCLNKQTIKKIVPTKTWNPWNPVSMKNKLPYAPSLIEKAECLYSYNWIDVKNNPNPIVAASAFKTALLAL